MLRLPLLFALALSACLSATGCQQPSALPQTPAIVLPDGQEVVLRSIDPIASNKSQPGEVVTFEVIRAISSDGLVVIPEHAVAVGRVLSAEHAGLAHHGGKLVVAIASVQLANGDYARLRAVESRKERNFGWRDVGGATLIAATIYYMPLAPVYLLAKGDDVNIPPGTRFTAYLDADQSRLSGRVWRQPYCRPRVSTTWQRSSSTAATRTRQQQCNDPSAAEGSIWDRLRARPT